MGNPFKKREEKRMTPQDAQKIIDAYGDVFSREDPRVIFDVSKLPVSKERIKEAFFVALANAQNEEHRKELKVAYFFLASFQPGVGSKQVGVFAETVDYTNIDDINRLTDEAEKLQTWMNKVDKETRILKEELRARGH